MGNLYGAALCLLALQALWAQGGEDEIADLRARVASDAGNVDLRLSLANACAARHEFDQAVEQLEQALRIDPGHLAALLHLSMAYIEWRGAPDEAEQTLRQGLRRHPDEPALLSLLANVHTEQARRAGSSRQWEKARQRLEAAKQEYRRAINHTETARLAAAAWLGLGSSHHLSYEIDSQRGEVEISEREAAAAADAYRRALALDPSLGEEIRSMEIDLALPVPRFPRTYARSHLSVTLEERLKRIRLKLTDQQPRGLQK